MAPKPMHQLTDIDEYRRVACCAICGPGTRVQSQGKRAPNAQGHKHRWICINLRHETWRGTHGLTGRERDLFLVGKVCEICGEESPTDVDHDHVTGKLRGALCALHNSALGFFGDGGPETERLLKAALKYVRKYHR